MYGCSNACNQALLIETFPEHKLMTYIRSNQMHKKAIDYNKLKARFPDIKIRKKRGH